VAGPEPAQTRVPPLGVSTPNGPALPAEALVNLNKRAIGMAPNAVVPLARARTVLHHPTQGAIDEVEQIYNEFMAGVAQAFQSPCWRTSSLDADHLVVKNDKIARKTDETG
jgi:hypothetical protein